MNPAYKFDPLVIGQNQRALFELEQGTQKARDHFEVSKKKLESMRLQLRRLEMSNVDQETLADELEAAGFEKIELYCLTLADIRATVTQTDAEIARLERDLREMDELLAEAQRSCYE